MLNFRYLRALVPGFLALVVTCVMLLGSPALAAPPQVKPPLTLLFSPESRLVLGTLTEINPTGRLVFKREKVLDQSQDVPELIDIRAGEPALSTVRLGETYVVGYLLFHRDKLYPGGKAPNRKGAILITSSGLEPALFRNSPVIRQILDLASNENGRASPQLQRLLIKVLTEDDLPLQLLAAGQIGFDPALGKRLSADDRAAIAKVGSDPETDNTVRSILISAAAERPAELGEWWVSAIKEVLASTPIGGYPSGAKDPLGLVLLAFTEVDAYGVEIPLASLTRWLRSPNQLPVEKACALLATKYPAQQKKALEEALGDSSLTRETRTYIDDQLRQLERQDAGSEAQQQGPG